ncbi:MAG: diacylglycerol kinase [Steroidobacteraceae bacterium]|nr:diacylglycerol kinase [Steroidobacteraceae bacterium]
MNELAREVAADDGRGTTATGPSVVPPPATSLAPARIKPRGFRRLLNSFLNSWNGLKGAWREEAAFRQECAGALVVIPAGLWFGETGVERALLIAPMLLILVVELLNSAVEAAIDRIGPERHPLSGLSKDLGSAAVFVSFGLLGATWLLVLTD